LNKHLYEVIFDVFPFATLVVDNKLRVLRCNQDFERLFLKSREEIISKPLSAIIPHKNLQNQAITILQNQEARTKLVELPLDTEKDNLKTLRATVTALPTGTLESPFCLIILEDITQQMQLEEQLVQSEKLTGMGSLARSIAHELGNPLSIISSTLQYIQGNLTNIDNQNFREAIETTMDNIHQMHILLRSLSDFTGSKRPQFKFCNLQNIISRLLTFISKETALHNINTHQELDPNVPFCEVDHQEIKQMFLNLFKNAIEAMPRGGKLDVKMSFVPKELSKNENRIMIEILDTGVEISEADTQYIFRPFYSTKPKGTGLGLSFCRRVVEEHGGEISVKSQKGKGTTFTITLPIKQRKEKKYA